MYVPKQRQNKAAKSAGASGSAGAAASQVNYKPEPYEILPSKRGHHLHAGNYKYMMNRQKNDIKYFACIHRNYPFKCKGTGKLDVESDVFYSLTVHTCDKPLPIYDDL